MSTPLVPPKEKLVPACPTPVKPTHLLCQRCASIYFRRQLMPDLAKSTRFPRTLSLHATRDSFLESLRLGCRLCILISSFFNLDEPDQPFCSDFNGNKLDAFISLLMGGVLCSRASFPRAEPTSACEIVTGMWVASKAKTILPKSTRLEVHDRHVSERYDIESHWPLLPEALHGSDEEAAVLGDMTTGSLANFQLARLWLSDCEQHHYDNGPRGCNQGPPSLNYSTTEPKILPARLINVENPRCPFLQDTNKIPPSPRYAALSYCWGEGARTTTTISNLPAFQAALPLPHLPKTFRDAIHATHKLSLSFLWIDALCIVQDDPGEVAHQISIMDSVYQNAVLTIYAQGAPSAHDGLFFRRDARHTRPLLLPANDLQLPSNNLQLPPNELQIQENILQLPVNDMQLLPNVKLPINDIDSHVTIKVAKLNAQTPDYPRRRGWVLQETVLSRRILFYGVDEISWSCTGRTASESEPVPRGGSSGGLRLCTNHCVASWNSDSEVRRCFQRWYRVAEDFSRRELSVASDGLPALAGLAHYFCAAHFGDRYTYVAGMWQDDVQAGLAWYLVQSPWKDYSAARLGGSWLPTWSWAAAGQNAVEFCAQRDRDLRGDERETSLGVEMVNAEVTLSNALVPFGQVKPGGCIWLRGMLKRAELRWDWEYWTTDLPGQTMIARSARNDHDRRGWLHLPSGEKPRFPALVCRDGDGLDGGQPVGTAALDGDFAAGVIPDAGAGNADAAVDFREVKLRKEVWCLLVMATTRTRRSWCLVLERSGDGYKRIGLLFLRDLEWFGTLRKRWTAFLGLRHALVDEQGHFLVPELVKIF